MKNKLELRPKLSTKTSLKTILIYTAAGLGIAAIVGVIIFLTLNFGNNEKAYAAIYFNSSGDGLWTDPASWGGTAPPVSTASDTHFTINHYITRNGSLTFAKDNSLTINSGATLEVTDSFSIAKNMILNIDGTLIIRGALLVDKDAILTVNGNGNIIVYGPATLGKETNFMINGVVDFQNDLSFDKNAVVTLNSGGELNVGGNLNFDQNASITNNGLINVGGDINFLGVPSQFNGGGVVVAGGAGCGYWTGSGACSENTILPVELLEFKVYQIESAVVVTWKTATELNNDYFSIERSSDGMSYGSIGEVKGAGNSNVVTEYEFVDEKPLNGITYYRLKQTDFDGLNETFRPVSVEMKMGKEPQISVYPNPFTGNQVHIKSNVPIDGMIRVIDQNGSEVYRETTNGGGQELTVTLRDQLPKGIYFLLIRSALVNEQVKIIKR